MEGVGLLPGPPSRVLALKSHPIGGGGGTVSLTIWKPPSMGLVFQDQPRQGRGEEGGACSLGGAQPLPHLLLWGCAITSLTFLVEFICSKCQIPPWEPRWLGPPCQIAQAFTTHRQAGAAGDLGLLFCRRSWRRSCCHFVVPELGGRPRRHFRDPFPHSLGPPSLALELPGCWALE